VRKEKPTTVKALVRAIRREWEGLSEEYAQALISSMSRRVKDLTWNSFTVSRSVGKNALFYNVETSINNILYTSANNGRH